MGCSHWSLCLWPGLPGAWQRGQWRSLGVAVVFAGLLNATLWATVWRPWGLSSWLLAGAWTQIGVFWAISAWNSHREYRRWVALPKSPQCEAWFREAQRDYLRGHWIEAEARLRRLIEFAPADVEARLLLAAVLRRAGRRQEASEQLRDLALLPGAEAWRGERGAEARKLEVEAGSADSTAARAA